MSLEKKEFMKAYDLDVCFVLDVTGSMGGTLDMMKRAVLSFPKTIESLMNEQGKRIDHLNVGIVAYKDHYVGDDPWKFILNFTTNMSAVQDFLSKIRIRGDDGGGNPCEPLWDAVYLALHSTWVANPMNKACRRIIIAFTDEDGCPLSNLVTGIKNFDRRCAQNHCADLPETLDYLAAELQQFAFFDGRLIIFGTHANSDSEQKMCDRVEYAKYVDMETEGKDMNNVYKQLLESFAKGGRKKSTADL